MYLLSYHKLVSFAMLATPVVDRDSTFWVTDNPMIACLGSTEPCCSRA
jgi:hypothetical protein